MITDIQLKYKGVEKFIAFYNEGKDNKRQIEYINTLFEIDNESKLKYSGKYDEYAYFGAFRCGKSFSQQLAVFLLCITYPKTKAVFVRNSYDQLKDSVILQMMAEFRDLGAFQYLVSERRAIFENGSELRFRSFDVDTNILSSEYDVIAVCQCEDIAYEMFLQLIGRASGKVLGSKGILLVEGNPASGWVKERYKDASKEMLKKRRIFFLEGQTQDNPWVTQDYIDSLIREYPSFWLDRYLFGLWDNREELIFSEFNEKEHVIEPIDPIQIPGDYLRRNALDWGWKNPSAILHSFVDYDGNLVIFDEFYRNQTLPIVLKQECNKHGVVPTVADYAMKGNKMPTETHPDRTVWSECEKNEEVDGKIIQGIRLIPCNKQELSNIILANTLLKQKKVYITKNCVNFLREIKNWKWKKWKLGADKNMPEEPVDKDNHTCDDFNMLVADLFGSKGKDKKKVKSFNESFYKAVITRSDEMKVTQLS